MSVRVSGLVDQSRAFRFYWLPSVPSTILGLYRACSLSLPLCLALSLSLSEIFFETQLYFWPLYKIYDLCISRSLTLRLPVPTLNSAPKSAMFTHFNCLWSGVEQLGRAGRQEMLWQTENCFSLLAASVVVVVRPKSTRPPRADQSCVPGQRPRP